MNNPNITDCTLINLPRIGDRNGQITSLNNLVDIPFEIRRIFYLYDIPGGESRGAHAHKQCHQLLIAASGSFEVVVEDGINKSVNNDLTSEGGNANNDFNVYPNPASNLINLIYKGIL